MYISLPFIAALSTLYYTATSALPQTSTTGVFVTRRQKSSTPSATTNAERYFHNCNGFLEKEKEAWDDANTLAKAALAWQAGAKFQPDADLWMGKDSATPAFNTRISTNLKNAVAVHARNWIWPDSSIDVWCNENGPDGLPPPPDEAKLPWLGACDNSSFAYSYIRKHAYWFHTGYTIVFCPRFWHDTTNRFGFKNSGKRGLSEVLALAKKFPVRFGGDPDRTAMNRGQTYLHELMHLDGLVSRPPVTDLESMDGLTLYGGPLCASLASLFGCAQKQPDSVVSENGEWGSTVNADNYAYFANSIYFREHLRQQEPATPTGDWRKFAKTVVSPPLKTSRAFDPLLSLGVNASILDNDTSFFDMVGPSNFALDSIPVPKYEPPPPPPVCIPGNTQTDPSLLNNLAAVYCSELGFVPLAPILIIDMTEADLSPANPTAKISVEFSYHKSDSGLPCGLSCLDTFTNLTQTCQFDNTITGSVNVTMRCGTFGFAVLPAS